MNDKTHPDAKALLAAQAMRQQAEDILRTTTAGLPDSAQDLSPQAMRRALHELQVHQIELEMQNEELRRAQLELDVSREQYFDLYDLAPVAYCTVSEAGLILQANMAAATLLGMARSNTLGQRISRFIAKAHQDTYYLYSKRMFTSGEPQAFELQMSKSDGVNFWVTMKTTFVRDAGGAPVQRMVLHDVTDAKIMAANVQASEARYRAMVEWSLDAIVVHRDGKIIYANPATLKMFGAKSLHEVLGKPLMERVHPDFRAIVAERVKNVTKLNNVASPMIEEVLLMLDGTPMNVEVQNISTIYDDAPATQVTMRNVTERRRAEDTLRDSEERYRNLFNSMDEGFCVIERVKGKPDEALDFRYFEVNPAFAVQAGLNDVVGKTIREMLPDESVEWLQIYDRVCTTGVPIRFEREFVTNSRFLELYVFRVGAPGSGKVAVIFNDITLRRKIETERLLMDAALLEKNTELSAARLVADKANQAKTDFLSSMSHELRTPLSAILGFAQLLDGGKPTPTPSQKRSVDHILQAGWYLLDLINEILDLALVESGKLSLSMEFTPLDGVLRECEAMIGPQADKSGIRVRFAAPGAAYAVQADHKRIKQVLVNLLSNAIKYNKLGGTVTVTCIEATPQRVRISVEDTGEGLAPIKIAQLFQPFNRLGQEATAVEGTGIGLVMTKRLVEMMGGKIGVHSTVGTGSVFWVELNLSTNSPSFADADADADADAASLRTLLYVEDNPANLMLVQELMATRPDIRLLTATDALSGVALARAERPDMVLMDINLPGISGTEGLKMLLGDPRTAHIPVVALSANAIPADIERGLAAGFSAYLTKPIRIHQFMQTLDETFKLAKAL